MATSHEHGVYALVRSISGVQSGLGAPGSIREIITSALDDGWNPEVPGSAWNFEHGLIRDKA